MLHPNITRPVISCAVKPFLRGCSFVALECHFWETKLNYAKNEKFSDYYINVSNSASEVVNN